MKLRPSVLLSLLFVFLMLPFIDKAAHIDDPLFLWSAARILQHPVDFYGFAVNWYGWNMPLHEIMQNPPLSSYYLALLLLAGGDSLEFLHLGMLLPGVGCVLGMYRLAGLFCRTSWLATLLFLSVPCFLVASGGFMADMPLCCLWIWCVYFHLKGEQEGSAAKRVLAVFLLAAAVLVKYNALALVPLLFVYSLLKQRGFRFSLLLMLFPLLVAYGYHLLTLSLYGHSLLFGAMGYSLSVGEISRTISWGGKLATGFAFLGGNLLVCLLLAPWIWRTRGMLRLCLAWFCATACILLLGGLGAAHCGFSDALCWGFGLQAGLFIVAGVQVHALAWSQYLRQRDAETALLLLWITGQCVFAFFLNWSLTSRTLLPLAPAACILAVRGMEQAAAPLLSGLEKAVPVVCCALVLALAVAFCDYRWAGAAREAALRIAQETSELSVPGWFGGHWGWQYYAEQGGLKPLDHHSSNVQKGDLLALPTGMLQKPIPLQFFTRLYEFSLPGCGMLSLSHEKHLAGFHSDVFGPLPFVFAPTRDHNFRIYVAKRSIAFVPKK